jgi:hypothetical protein
LLWALGARRECLRRSSPVHATPLIWSPLIIPVEIAVENRLHLLDGFEPGATALDTEVLVEKRAVQPLDNTVGLRTLDPAGAVLDFLERQEQLVGVLVGPPAVARAFEKRGRRWRSPA